MVRCHRQANLMFDKTPPKKKHQLWCNSHVWRVWRTCKRNSKILIQGSSKTFGLLPKSSLLFHKSGRKQAGTRRHIASHNKLFYWPTLKWRQSRFFLLKSRKKTSRLDSWKNGQFIDLLLKPHWRQINLLWAIGRGNWQLLTLETIEALKNQGFVQ